MDARVRRKLGVKGCRHDSSLPDGDRILILAFGGDDFNAGADAFDLRGADEDHFERCVPYLLFYELSFADGTVELASVCVAADADVKRAQPGLPRILNFAGEENCSSAGSEGGLRADELLELFKARFAEDFQECAGFAARDYQAVDFIELLWLLDEHDLGAQLSEPFSVGVKVALDG